jgi:hypothetical protein
MDSMLLRLFQEQVRGQCAAVIAADRTLTDALTGLKQGDPDQRNQAMDTVWSAIQDVLTASANISKALWGSKGKKAVEREPLRASLGVSDPSVLQGVDMRNNFEHFDERIMDWWVDDPAHVYIDRNLGSMRWDDGTISAKRTFRNYDPATGTLIFWGDTFDVHAIVEAASTLLITASREAQKPHWAH